MRAVARIDAGAITRNAATLRAAAGAAGLCAVVKADGYGHGAATAARAALAGGATWLAVATASEARALREAGLREQRVLVMGALDDDDLAVALGAGADVVAWTADVLRALPSTARVHVKLDSGMGRLGTRDGAAAAGLADALAARGLLAGAMTHFATADERGDAFFAQQLAVFGDWASPLRERHAGIVIHAANSAATLRDPAAAFDLVRCGVALYGLDPFGEDPAARGLEPALELTSRVAALKRCAAGESAGYGRRFVAQSPRVLATVPIGYGDGVRRALTNNAECLVAGVRVPLVGTVSMDNVTLDVTGLETAVGDEVVLLGARGGERVLAEEWARRIGTINYEITCGLSARVPRVVIDPRQARESAHD